MIKFKKAFIALFLIAGILLISLNSSAQETRPKPKKKAKSKILLIKGGTVHTITRGIIHGGCVLVRDGKIQKVGKNIIPPKDALVLDVKNKWVLPGFVVAQSYPIGMRSLIREDRRPKIFNYLDPYSLQLRLCLASGITTYSPVLSLRPSPARKNYSFINAILKPTYGRLKEMLVKEPAYLVINIPILKPSEKGELRGLFQRAREFITKEMEYEKSKDTKSTKAPVVPPDLKNYVAILKREMPVRFNANRRKDILKVLAFMDEFNVRAHILGAGEGWLLADEVGRRNVSTILQPEAFLRTDPYKYPPDGSNIKNALIQKEKGIKFAIISTSPNIGTGGMLGNDLLTFPLAGAYAVRGGLDEKDALKAITLWPAELLGIGHRIGSIEEGKDADIIVLDGNPFDYRTYVDYTIINGEILYDKSKSSLYKKIPKPKKIF